MPESFVSLAFVLAGTRAAEALPPVASAVSSATGDSLPASPEGRAVSPPSAGTVARELTLMRLAALEAYARARVRLLDDLAREVLGRELRSHPCDLERLARIVLTRFADHEPIRLRVAPGAARSLSVDVPVIEDPALDAGDFVVEVRDGTVDARFDLRLAAVFEDLS